MATWLVLQTVLSLQIREELSLDPPLPEHIAYRDYLPGGRFADRLTLDLDPGQYADAQEGGESRWRLQIDTGQDSPRLITGGWTHADFGWPAGLLRIDHVVRWDVTNPHEPFEPAYGVPRAAADRPINLSTYCVYLNDDARMVSFSRPDRSLLIQLGLLLLLPLMVLSVPIVLGRRRNRRLRRGACVQCGHLLGPEPRPKLCPECGERVAQPLLPRRQRGTVQPLRSPALFFSVLFILLLGAALFSFELAADTKMSEHYEGQLTELADAEFHRTLFAPGREQTSIGRTVASRQSGWPWPIFERHWLQFFELERGKSPRVRLQRQEYNFRHERPGVFWHRVDSDDPSLVMQSWLLWDTALIYLYVLGLMAALLTLCLSAVRLYVGHRRAQRQSSSDCALSSASSSSD